MSAGGIIVLHNKVTARGGKGGKGIGYGSRGGGGGSGGRISGFAQSLSILDNGIFDATGGTGGLDEQLVAEQYRSAINSASVYAPPYGNFTVLTNVTLGNGTVVLMNVTRNGTLPERWVAAGSACMLRCSCSKLGAHSVSAR
jgi:hypothetical protein